MNTPQSLQDTNTRIKRVKQRLVRWWSNTPTPVLRPDPERVPTIEEALEQDARTRWMMLMCLDGAVEVSLKFLETITHCASTEERQRSLDWLLTTGCITEYRRWERECFWQQRREVRSYAITSNGTTLLARINDTATAEQLGIQTETTDPLRNVSRLWWHVVYVALYAVLLALSAAVMVPLLRELFR